MDDEGKQIGDPYDQMTFSADRCFVCGCLLDKKNYTHEHVIPKWLQRRFDLWDKELVLLNGTPIKYRNLKIPCCKKCNNAMGDIEKKIERGVNQGYKDFLTLDERLIFQWLNKISYGFLFRELSLKAQLSNVNSGSIYSAEFLKDHKMQYLFLKSIIAGTDFVDKPWSLLIFKINPSIEEPYWSYDSPFNKTICIRMNDIGIIANLMDSGFSKQYFMEHKEMVELLGKTLHPIQFSELSAKMIYKASLFDRDPFYTISFDDNLNPKAIISHSISGHGYKEWKDEEYASLLAFILKSRGFNQDDLYKGNDMVMTFLRNEDGTFRDFFA